MTPAADRLVAVVAGATRGAGRGTAVELGALGATVYCVGRSVRGRPSSMARPETIEETAALVDAAGGRGVPVRADLLEADDARALADRLRTDQDGRLDVLVNDVWGGDPLTRWGVPFWEHPLEDGLRVLRTGLDTHLVASWHLAPLLVARGRGVIVEVTDGIEDRYRGSLFYDLAKAGVIRAARAQAADLAPHGVACVAVTPGFLRSEAVLDHFGVTEATWRDAIATDPHFAASETPRFVGRGIARLVTAPDVLARTGTAVSSWELAREFGFTDVDGGRPDWGAHWAASGLG